MKWLLAFRIKTLTAAIVPVLVASCLVNAEKLNFSWSVVVYTLLSSLFIQIGTNLFNDAIDFKKGADTDTRLGPSRMTQTGEISSKNVMLGGVACFILAIVCAIPLVVQGGLPIVYIGLASLFFGYTYTGGPFPLAYKGLGDLFVVLFFGVVAVMGVYYLHTSTWSFSSFVAGLQIGFLATVLIVINNLRDMEQDKLVNKKTMAVRFGEKFSRHEIVFLIMASFILVFYWVHTFQTFKVAFPLLIFPLAMKLILGIFKNRPGEIYNNFLQKAALLHLLFGLLLSIGFVL